MTQKLWRFSYGSRPHAVSAFEYEFGSPVKLRYWDPATQGRDKRRPLSLALRVRKSPTSKVDPRLESAVRRVVIAVHKRLSAGLSPVDDRELTPAPVHHDSRSPQDTLTIKDGFDLALRPGTGKYPSIDTRRYSEMRSIQNVLLAPGMLPPGLTWAELEKSHIVALWRRIASIHKREPTKFGARRAEVLIDAIFSVSSWLRDRQLIPAKAAEPPRGWRTELKSEWQAMTKAPVEPERPRHTAEESLRIFAALNNPDRNRFRELLRLATDGSQAALPTSTRESIVRDETGRPIALRLRVNRRKRDGSTSRLVIRIELDDRGRAAIAPVDTPDRAPDAPLFSVAPHVLDVDPRLELAVMLGAEMRLGQVGVARRSQLDLTHDQFAPFGSLTITTVGNKTGGTVVFTKDQRELLDLAFATFLAEAESAYREGDRTTDYYLFPHGRLVGGIVPLERARHAPLARDALRKAFRGLERAAGVESVAGRGWYGLRRQGADQVAGLTSDSEIHALAGGWTVGSPIPSEIYRERLKREKLHRTSLVRQAGRSGGIPTTTEGTPQRTGSSGGTSAETTLELLTRLPSGLAATVLECLQSLDAVPESAAQMLVALPMGVARQVLEALREGVVQGPEAAGTGVTTDPENAASATSKESRVGPVVGPVNKNAGIEDSGDAVNH